MDSRTRYVSPMRPIWERAKQLNMDESFDLLDFPCDEKSRIGLGSYLRSNGMLKRFKIRSLIPKGVRVICVGTYGSWFGNTEETFTNVYYPVLKHKQAAPVHSSRCPWLGYLANVSMHSAMVPRTKRCSIKGCVFPTTLDVCTYHQRFFWYSVSLVDSQIDMGDLYNDESPAETVLSVAVPWDTRLKFEHRGRIRYETFGPRGALTSWSREMIKDSYFTEKI